MSHSPDSSLELDSPAAPLTPSTTAEGGAVGLLDPHVSQSRRKLLDLTNRLSNTGVQLDIDLPQIAVVGMQSVGKSSLIESISGITLPRVSGTCTRCPTECRLSHSDAPWKCVVSLRLVTDAHGQPRQHIMNETFGEPINDKSLVEERIRRAQRAILNPATSPEEFLRGDDVDVPSGTEVSFSTNCVSLQISGPELTDLAFCDLPGLIAKGPDVGLVSGLIESYISKPSCLILLAVACEVDFETQGAYDLAKKHDPEGKRTIGVLTKPDRIPIGEESHWFRIIVNDEEPLENGWFCVKQPNSAQLKEGITWQGAREKEREFFRDEPWGSLSFALQERLGTSALTERLSDILAELISRRLPEIQEELQALLHKTELNLSGLPAPPSADPISEVLHIVGSFVSDISRHVEGVPGDGLMQAIRPAHDKFKEAIRSTAPDFRPYDRATRDPPELPPAEFLANEEDESPPLEGESPIYLDDVMARARRAITRELPDNYPFIVTRDLVQAILQLWREPVMKLFDSIQLAVNQHMKTVIATHLRRFQQGNLQQAVSIQVSEHLKECKKNTMLKVEWLLRLEQEVFTLNTHYLASYKDNFLTYYRGVRQSMQNGSVIDNLRDYKSPTTPGVPQTPFQTGMSKVMSGLTEIGINGTRPSDLPKLLPPDPYEAALDIMASVRAYFQVAYKRFTDMVALAIDQEFVRGLERDLQRRLWEELGISGSDSKRRCREYLQEPHSITARRDELQKKKERLEKAKQELLEVYV